MAEKVYEGRWECPSCNSECLGRHEKCPNCGAPRPAGVEFYLPAGATEVTDAALLEDAASGPDWYCSHCGSANADLVDGVRRTRCAQCGNARDGEDRDHAKRIYGTGQAPETAHEARDLIREENLARTRARRETRLRGAQNGDKRGRGLLALALFILAPVAIVAAVAAAVFLTWSTSTFEITGFRWSREIPVQAIRTVHEQGWQLPAKAFNDQPVRKIRSYVSVVDHYETRTRQVSERVMSGTESYSCGTVSQGNGYFTTRTCTRPTYTTCYRTESYQDPVYRQDPVWDTWHRYDIDRWVTIRTRRAAGTAQEATWPEISLAKGERVGTRRATYQVTMVDTGSGEKSLRDVSFSAWSGLRRGDDLTVDYNLFGLELKNDLEALLASRN